jgi:hypothetical protein
MSLEMLKNKYNYVSLATYFTDVDKEPDLDYGLFDRYLQPKPAASVFRDFAASIKIKAPTNIQIKD